MDQATFLRESFRATIAFGLLALAGLLLASLAYGVYPAMLLALAAAGAAYASQLLATLALSVHTLQRPAIVLQLLSLVAWCAGFIILFRGL
jgi:hypothetical protein